MNIGKLLTLTGVGLFAWTVADGVNPILGAVIVLGAGIFIWIVEADL